MRCAEPIILVLTGLFLGLSLGGCHGRNSAPPPALKLALQQPPPGGLAELDAAVVIVFADGPEPDPDTLAGAALQVRDGGGAIPGSHFYDRTTKTWTWNAHGELPRGALVTVVLADSVRGLGGERMGGGQTWSFRVRPGAVQPAVQIVANATGHGGNLFVAQYPDGRAQICAGTESWHWDVAGAGVGMGVGAVEFLAGGAARGLHLDAGGNAVALTVTGSGYVPLHLTRRSPAGAWSVAEAVMGSGAGFLLGATLRGTANAALLATATQGFTSPTHVRTFVSWSSAVNPGAWQSVAVPSGSPHGLFSALGGDGTVMMLTYDGTFVLAERHDPAAGTMSAYTVSQGEFFVPVGVVADGLGGARALWRVPGQITRQSLALPGAGFGPATDVPVLVPSQSFFLGATNGAVVGWSVTANPTAFRSEAGASHWTEATLVGSPLAVAISPRGEAVFVHFELPDSLLLARWRAGEPLDPPIRIAGVASPFNGQKRAAVAIDATGRVVVVFSPDEPGELVGVRVE